jgi:hypothetical protein
MAEAKRSPDRLISQAKKSDKGSGKKLRGQQKEAKLIEVGD